MTTLPLTTEAQLRFALSDMRAQRDTSDRLLRVETQRVVKMNAVLDTVTASRDRMRDALGYCLPRVRRHHADPAELAKAQTVLEE